MPYAAVFLGVVASAQDEPRLPSLATSQAVSQPAVTGDDQVVERPRVRHLRPSRRNRYLMRAGAKVLKPGRVDHRRRAPDPGPRIK
jgi:hypothetical protein